MRKIVVFTGAGVSAESNLPTFRGSDGLWEGHRVEDVATPQAWRENRELVLEFYNQRRADCLKAKPNAAHLYFAALAREHEVRIITQNIDDLHERAGSTNVLHLHGEIRKAQSSLDPSLVYPIRGERLDLGDRCELGAQLRPHVVWFGEPVPNMGQAVDLVHDADLLIIVGTSLQVYPAATLAYEVSADCQVAFIDPSAAGHALPDRVIRIPEKATIGVKYLAKMFAE